MDTNINTIVSTIKKNKGNTKEIITQIITGLSKKTFIEKEAVQLTAYGRRLQKIGKAIENHASDEAVKYLSENKMNMDVSDMNVSYREYFDEIQTQDDEILNKYEEKQEKLETELKDIKQSIKNRKEQLKYEGKIIKILRTKSLSIRNK